MYYAMLNEIKLLFMMVRYKLLLNYQSNNGFIPSKLVSLGAYNNHINTSRMAASSIPDSVIGIFHCHNPSGHNTGLASTQRLTEISTSFVSWW
jgi:hypothetical protein